MPIQICTNIKVKYLEKGTVVFNQNEQPHLHFYIVKDGAIGLFRSMDDDEIFVDICDEGDIFGLRPLIQNDHYLMSAKATEESILYAIPVEILKKIIEVNDKVHKYIIASFSSNIKTPYANTKALFGNIDTLDSNNINLTDFQTAEYSKNPVTCSKNTGIQEAAQIMSAKRVGSILIIEEKNPIGIITDKDLRLKVATGIIPISEKVSTIMSSPVITVPKNITTAEAQIAMLKHKITHLCITKDGTPHSELIGIMSEHDIVVLQGNNPSGLIKELKRAKDITAVKYIREKTSNLLKSYMKQNIPIAFVAKIISEITDTITLKVIEFSLNEMETEPPVKFGWLALGSQGRKEQLLITDQDNALIFENVTAEDYNVTKNYFLKLAQKINNKLHLVGYENCPADMMASNPKWCLCLDEWKQQFDSWITQPSEKAIMMCTIFFDYNLVYGDEKLVNKLAKSIFKSIDSYEIFLNFLGKNALINPPPLGFFRQFLVEDNGENKDQFDLKARALMPLIDAARLLTLSHQLKNKNNTIERFEALILKEPQNKDLYFSCIDAFKILLRYRTNQGIKHNDSGRYIELNTLTKPEKLKLKGCFKPIKDIQELLNVRYNLSQMM